MLYNDDSPGKQFLNSLVYDWEKLIADGLADIEHLKYLQSTYSYSPAEQAEQEKMLEKLTADVEYCRKRLSELGGAENGKSIPTESHKDSESPTSGFTGITCTTV